MPKQRNAYNILVRGKGKDHMGKNIYSFWGKRPFLYKLACMVTFLGKEERLRKRGVEKLELKKGDTVLDLACGTGLNFPYLYEAVGGGGKIIGLDYSLEMLSAAQKKSEENNWKNIKLVNQDASKLSLNYKVDGILSTLGISAIPRHREALKKAIDILKDNKKIVILDAQPFTNLYRIFNPFIKSIYKYLAGWDYTKEIKKDLGLLVSKLEIEEYNKGTIYILTGTK